MILYLYLYRRVIIYPQVSGGGSISVYLSVVQAESLPLGWEVKADCSILIHNQVSGNYLCFQGRLIEVELGLIYLILVSVETKCVKS